jgi:UDP-glucose 4-epimerase
VERATALGRKILVTGGAGFIGSHIADAYIARGDQVWVLDNLSTGKRDNVPKGATFVDGGVETDAVARLFERVGGFDIISHHAAQIDVRKSVTDPVFDARVNIIGLLNLLEAARKYDLKRFVFVSSGGVVYGEAQQRPTPETAPKLPLSPYGVSKLTSEYYLYYYHRTHGLDYVAVRYANVYGPRQDPHGEAGVVAIFCTRIRTGQPCTIFGDGEQSRDYVFVEDVVRANLTLTDATLAPAANFDDRAFNVGTGIETTVNQLAKTLMKGVGRETPLVHAPERRGELRHSALNNSRLKSLGWSPRRELSDGLLQTYRYIDGKEQPK